MGLPSKCTVHAPQSPVPHPSFGPVRPIRSRRASSRVSQGWTSTSTGSSLTVQLKACLATSRSLLLLSIWHIWLASGGGSPAPRRPAARTATSGAGSGQCGGQRTPGQDANEVTAEVGRAALVADRPRDLQR